ncbi:MAG: phosphoadenosine phosphosulfate reductase [Phycisphaerales bacterium]|jgi:phosphoadenosine phosphosulfate reductase|nr:phosphoadenosine phosphosulfate reductase [Phycisphaerales bacterium]
MLAAAEQAFDLIATNAVLDTYGPRQVVDWAAREFGEGLVMSSSFGAESALLLHMATRAKPDIKVIVVDTGYLFPETHQFLETLRHRFDLNIWTYRTRQDPIAYLKEAGEVDPTFRTNVERCCEINKNEPFDRAMQELKPRAWLRGIRRQQADTRADRKPVEWSRRFNCYAVSPLLSWSRRDIHQYMKQHDLPYHPLFDQGYASIGCNPLSCTRPIQIGEDPRAGRWSGTGKLECGLHLESDGSGI